MSANDQVKVDPVMRRKVVAASFIGNFVEWFDFAAYGYLAVTLSMVFFPKADPTASLLAVFAIFALPFFIRPVGGFVWGHVGDHVGRRTALSLSILLMSGATFCLGLLPGYATIGVAAPVLLTLLRVVQAFSASGEYAGASAFLVEYAPEGKRGLYAAVVPASTSSGLLLGSLMAALLTGVLTDPQMESWGWRIPFLMAGPMGLIGRYIRLKLEDTPAFRALEEQAAQPRTPIAELFSLHSKPLFLAFGAAVLNAVAFYVVLAYMPTYLSQEVGFGDTESFLATTLALVTYIGFIFGTGMLSDRFGRRTMLLTASALFIVFTVPAFLVLDTAGFLMILAVEILLGAMLTLNDGTLPSFLSEMFPTRVRYTGFAVSFNLANAIFGGTAPYLCTWLITNTGDKLVPAYYLIFAAAVSLIAVLYAKETSRKPLAT